MLHLNLIGWGMPIGTGLQGLKDTLACLGLRFVRGQEKSDADRDILYTLKSPKRTSTRTCPVLPYESIL